MNADEVYLRHGLDAIEKIGCYTADGRDAFVADDKTQDAVIRNFEIIGEAVKNLSSALRNEYGQVEWTKIAGMRHKLIHHYFGVKLDIVLGHGNRRSSWLQCRGLRHTCALCG